MNTTVKYVLIGGAVAGVVYLVAKSSQPANTPLQTVTNGITSVVASITGAIKGSGSPSSGDASLSSAGTNASGDESGASVARLAKLLPNYHSGGDGQYAPSAWSSYGDAAIADGAGYSHIAGRSIAQPSASATAAQRALYGDSPKSKFAIR